MTSKHGEFSWYELLTTDIVGAESFYAKVLGWTAADSGLSDRQYKIFSIAATMVGGLMQLPQEALALGARPGWMGYLTVDDVDLSTKRVQAAGGMLHLAPEEIPGIGRFSVVADPDGAPFVLFKSANPASADVGLPHTPGTVAWRELHSKNWERAFAFYAELFGWKKTEQMDMGPLGIYQMFATDTESVGGIMTKLPETPVCYWLYYFQVATLDAALDRVTTNGGRIIHEPHEVPGGWVTKCFDPQGAVFALVAPIR
jgi:predicted enzyme related to lactoylglutathione lyase